MPVVQAVFLDSYVPSGKGALDGSEKSGLFIFKRFHFYLFTRDTQRGAQTQAEGEAGSLQGARPGTRSQVSRTTPWAEGGAKPLSHAGCPRNLAYGDTALLGCISESCSFNPFSYKFENVPERERLSPETAAQQCVVGSEAP